MFSPRIITTALKRGGQRFAISIGLTVVALAAISGPVVYAQAADDLEVLRVDLPLTKNSFKNGELEISRLIAENTYIDTDEFNLRAIELEAHTNRKGEVRLKVGRYVTPPVPLPGKAEKGLLRIEAPHRANTNWRLLIEDRATISSLTAVLEPRHDNPDHYHSRYEQRGYSFGQDPYFRSDLRHQSRLDNWPYSWLGNSYNYNRSASHWLWLNDSRARFQLNPSFGFNHLHSRNCYDRFGRHLAFNGGLRAPIINRSRSQRLSTRRSERARSYLHERQLRDRNRIERRTDRIRRDLPSAQQPRKSQAIQRAEQARRTQQAQQAQRAQRIQAQRAQQAQQAQRIQAQRAQQAQRVQQNRRNQQARQQRIIERRESSRSNGREALRRQIE